MPQILVVEDDITLRFTLAETLRSDGYDVVEAASADEAAIILSSVIEVGLVVTDVEMPGDLNGLELARHIRKKSPKLPVIVVSGNPYEQDASAIGVTAFFPKPYIFQKLIDFIATIIPYRNSYEIDGNSPRQIANE